MTVDTISAAALKSLINTTSQACMPNYQNFSKIAIFRHTLVHKCWITAVITVKINTEKTSKKAFEQQKATKATTPRKNNEICVAHERAVNVQANNNQKQQQQI